MDECMNRNGWLREIFVYIVTSTRSGFLEGWN